MRLALALTLATAVVLGTDARAQGVPYGEHILSIFSNNTSTTNGLLLVDRANSTCKAVNGLANTEVNAVQLDPINENVWLGDLTGSGVRVVTIDANCNISSETSWGVATSTSTAVNGIAFDNNGNPAVAAGAYPTSGGVYLMDRNNAGVVLGNLAPTGPSGGTVNAICRDSRGNLYYGVTGTSGGIFQLPVNPDCTYGAPVFLGPIFPASNSTTISGVDICEATNELWWTSFGSGGTSVGSFALPGGPAATSTNSTTPALNWIEYDVRNDDFTVCTAGIDPDEVYVLQKTFATSTACTVPPNGQNGVPSCIDTCDCTDAQTLIVPACVTSNTLFTLELGTCCPPGFVGGTFITGFAGTPQAIVVNSGVAPASGRLASPAFTGLVWPAGVPAGVIVFVSACGDPTLTRITVGAPVFWPASVQ